MTTVLATTGSLLAGIARHGVERGEIGAIAAPDWPAAIAGITAQRLTGQAVAAAADGALALAADQLDELLDRHEEQLAIDLRIERMLLECDTVLRREGIPARVLKGPAAARFYDAPELRSFGDGDVLVRGADMQAALDVLATFGMRRRFAAPRARFDTRFVKAVSLRTDEGLELDLHRALTPGPYGVLFDAEQIFATPPDHVVVGDRMLPCLDPQLAFAHACAHAALGDDEPRLVPLRDVVELLRRGLDTPPLIRLFERFRSVAVAHRVVQLVERVLGVRLDDPFAQWARSYRPTRADHRLLRAYRGGPGRYAAQTAATFWVLPTIRDRLAFASALAFPTRGYLDARQTGYSRRLLRGAMLVLRWRPR
jgi:hypothetical protein